MYIYVYKDSYFSLYLELLLSFIYIYIYIYIICNILCVYPYNLLYIGYSIRKHQLKRQQRRRKKRANLQMKRQLEQPKITVQAVSRRQEA